MEGCHQQYAELHIVSANIERKQHGQWPQHTLRDVHLQAPAAASARRISNTIHHVKKNDTGRSQKMSKPTAYIEGPVTPDRERDCTLEPV